jgi:hypothetical protein
MSRGQHRTRQRRSGRRPSLIILALAALFVAAGASAWAFWGDGSQPVGNGAPATAASVNKGATPTASSAGTTLTISWAASTLSNGVAVSGYTVNRYDDATKTQQTSVTACTGAATTCTENSVPQGSWVYRVTPMFATNWHGPESEPSNTATSDALPPTQTVTLTSGVNASQTGNTIFFRNAIGSFSLSAAVTDSGTGPASVTFPDITTTGWTHPAQNVATGAGSAPTITYSSSTYSFIANPSTPATQSVVGKDAAGNTVTTALTVTPDSSGPAGGALTVNSLAANGSGTTSTSNATSFTIGTRTDYNTDTGSGLATSILTRESATLTNTTCGTFASSTVLTSNPAQSGLATGCYRYTLTGTDKVGNTSSISTIVKVDLVAPTQTVTLTSGVNASQTGNTIFFGNAIGSFSLSAAVTDSGAGPASVTFPLISGTGWTHPAQTVTSGTGSAPTITYSSSTYSFTASGGAPATTAVVGTDTAGNAVSTALTFTPDTTGPTGGALTVNGQAAASVATTSTSNATSFTIGTRTDYNTDTGSGLATSILSRESATLTNTTCGTFGSSTVLTSNPAQSGLATGCYRYTLTGTDNVGNTSNITTIVQKSTGGIKVQYLNGDANAPGDNQIKPHLQLFNTGSASLDLKTVTVRYYFTHESVPAPFATACDYAAMGCANIASKVVLMPTPLTGADAYLEVTFTGGTLLAGTNTGAIQLRFNQSTWLGGNFTESNDYSYGTDTSYTDAPKIVGFVDGALVTQAWGIVPT